MAEKCEDVALNNDQIIETVNQVIDLAQTMRSTIDGCSDQSFVQAVSLDHVMWKSKVYEHLASNTGLTENDLEDHRSCRLGEWYSHGQGSQKFSHLRSFQRLDEPHRQVHEYGKAAIAAHNRGDKHEAENQAKMMESASNQVQRCLNDLLNEMNG